MDRPADAVMQAPPVSRRRPSFLELVRQGFRDMTGRPRLVRFLVAADMKRTHVDTMIGRLWWILDPLLQLLVYWILVGFIFRRSTPDFALFLFAAILPWKWFSTTLSDSMVAITSHDSIIRQIAFPKIVLPTAASIAGVVSFGFGLIALAFVYLMFMDRLSAWVLAIPLIAVVQFVFTLALGVLLSAANTFYRDVQNILRHALRLWFYLSPALYSINDLPDDNPIRTLLLLNPWTVILESYRAVTWGTTAPYWAGLAILLVLSLILLVVATATFKRVEASFAKVL